MVACKWQPSANSYHTSFQKKSGADRAVFVRHELGEKCGVVKRSVAWIGRRLSLAYSAVELPPLTQTKNTRQKPKTRIVLCRQLGECCVVAAALHNTPPIDDTTQFAFLGFCVVFWSV